MMPNPNPNVCPIVRVFVSFVGNVMNQIDANVLLGSGKIDEVVILKMLCDDPCTSRVPVMSDSLTVVLTFMIGKGVIDSSQYLIQSLKSANCGGDVY